MNRDYYLNLRNLFLPEKISTIFVLESPPMSGLYFYDPTGKISEPLFRAMMKDVLHFQPNTKSEGLRKFQDAGFILVDATYTPVNDPDLSLSQRNKLIYKDYPLLVSDLRNVTRKNNPRIILVKANICRLLENRLLADGFNVANNGRVIPFPSSGQQAKFKSQISKLL